MRNSYLYVTLLAVLGFNNESAAQTMMKSSPRLVVNIIIDQLRSDLLEANAPLYGEDGFKRLLGRGLVYANASCNYEPVDRASSIATVATGAPPYYHGIVGLNWLDKATLRPQNCVRDREYMYSPASLATSTLGDELKVASQGVAHVFSFAPFVDAAILSAGHAADGAAWTDRSQWSSSFYYQPVSKWLSNTSRLLAVGQNENQAVTDMVLRCVSESGVGQDDVTDLLNVVYRNEAYEQLDYQLSRLITGIENQLGHDRVLFCLTSTGYSNEEEEQDNKKYRIPTGELSITRTGNLLNMYLGAVYGSARYVASCYKNQIFLDRELLDRRNIQFGDILQRAQEFLLQLSGIRNVYTSSQLLTSDSQLLAKKRNGFSVEKCGDLLIDVAPGWKLTNDETGETSFSRASYISFPIIFYGAGVETSRVTTPVTTDRIAPTIAKAIRIRAPNACSSEPLF